MSSSPLRILAGPTAYHHIQQYGLRADDFQVMVGASGGPKWFCLFGLDQYFFGDFFRQRQTPLHLLGSSAGAWRFACFAQNDAVAASKRFCQAYSTLSYPVKPDIDQVTAISTRLVNAIFPAQENLDQVIDNKLIKLNLVVAKAGRRFPKSTRLSLQLGGFALTAAANFIHRRNLQYFFQRILFYSPGVKPPFFNASELPTTHIELTKSNLRQALMASGAIPLAIHPVTEIPGADNGIYWDGGVIDYHFDLPFSQQGLVLYPHFYPTITPGWFDRVLKWRKPNPANYHNVVLLCPSEDWVQSLPYHKIPDRDDFNLPDEVRIAYWQTVVERSHELAEALIQGNYQPEPLIL